MIFWFAKRLLYVKRYPYSLICNTTVPKNKKYLESAVIAACLSSSEAKCKKVNDINFVDDEEK
jgi:hypothetical protein